MDQPVRLKGDFTANPRRYAAKGKPSYFVKLGIPGTDKVFNSGGFVNEYDHVNKDGSIVKLQVISGTTDIISPNMSIREQAAAVAAQRDPDKAITYGKKDKVLQPGQWVLFEKAEEYKQPKDGVVKLNDKGQPTKPSDWFGSWNHDGELIEIGSWFHKDPRGFFFIGGKTQFPQSRDTAPGMEATTDIPDVRMSEEELADLAAREAAGHDFEQSHADLDQAAGDDGLGFGQVSGGSGKRSRGSRSGR